MDDENILVTKNAVYPVGATWMDDNVRHGEEWKWNG